MLAILRRKTSSSQETLRLPENHRIPLPAGLPWYLILGIGALLLLLAVVLFDHFRHVAPALWYSPYHDRNGHYFRCQSFGMALRRGDVPGFIKAIHFATVWPPLHPLVTGLILAVGGLDYRLAVLTSLGAWVAGCWFTFALASRLVPRYRAFAGGIALVFVLASPAHRAFACDIMIESLGAALTMAVLYFYVAVCQEPTVWRGRCFALLFLALFLTKYNYWMLVAAGLFLGTLPEIGRTLRDVGPGWWSPSTWLGWLAAQLRHPLTYLILPALALAFHVQFVGPISFTLAGREQIMDNLAVPGQLCFVLLLVRIFPWWWRRGRLAVGGLPILARQLVHWFVYPVILWFLWPRRLSSFLWYVTHTDHGRNAPASPWLGNFGYYWQCLQSDYHANFTSLVLAILLIALALLGWRRWLKEFRVLFLFLVVAALLTNYHSANRSRFLLSWLPAGWAVAGVGAALIPEWIGTWFRRNFSNTTGWPARFLGSALLTGALAGLAVLQGPALFGPGHAEEGGPDLKQLSLLPFADAVSPEVIAAQHPALLSDASFELVFDWRVREYRRLPFRLMIPPRNLLEGTFSNPLKAWLREHSCDVLVLIDSPFPPGLPNDPRMDVVAMREFLASSGDFVLSWEWRSQEAPHITAQVWRHAPTYSWAKP